jgi:single-stranded-DNA-specific exonuclease
MKYDKWKILSHYPSDPIKEILKSRGVVDDASYFNPDYDSLQRSLGIPGMDFAMARLSQAKKKKEKIAVFMDYDADGICGGAILYLTLKKDFKNIEWEVPLRSAGYGLNKKSIDNFLQSKVNIILTVDCGIRNNDEIAYAYSKGIEVIVFDHHKLGDSLPEEAIIVHPLLKSNKLEFRAYSGGGVAFMFARAYLNQNGQEKWLLDLAAISSVADMVPLISDNRTIVKYGLTVLKKTKNIGLKSLYKIAQINESRVGTYEIGFQIAPRLNAAGRMDDPRKSFKLLTTTSNKEAEQMAKELNSHNQARQEELDFAQKSACDQVGKKKLYHNKIIIIKDKDWSEGILGLIAGRVCDTFYRPTIALRDEKMMRGSARSVPGVDITKLLATSGDLLASFGGHNQAAGLSLERKKFQSFLKHIINEGEKIPSKVLSKQLQIDALVGVEGINMQLAKKIQKMEPFGLGNKKPVFVCEKMEITNVTKIGKDEKHLRIEMKKNGYILNGVVFNAQRNSLAFKNGEILDVAFNLKIDEYNGREKLDLFIEDAKK